MPNRPVSIKGLEFKQALSQHCDKELKRGCVYVVVSGLIWHSLTSDDAHSVYPHLLNATLVLEHLQTLNRIH